MPLVQHHLDLLDFLLARNVALLEPLLLLEAVYAASTNGRAGQLIEQRVRFCIHLGDVEKFGQVLELLWLIFIVVWAPLLL